MNIRKYCLEYLVVICLFLALGAYRLWPSLTTPDAAIFNYLTAPDGLGTYINRALLKSILSDQGLFAYLFKDNFSYELLGADYLPQWYGPSLFWRLAYLPLLFSESLAEHTYQILSLGVYTLTASGAYFLARTLKAPIFLAFIFGLLFTIMDNFNFRLQVGHISLSTPFGILLQTAFTIQAARTGTLRHYILLGLTSWLSFQVNEYYGYYGTLYCAALYLGCIIAFLQEQRVPQAANYTLHAQRLVTALLLFTALMFFSYSRLFLGILGLSEIGIQSLTVVSRDVAEVFHYSVKNPLAVFHSLWMNSNALLGNHPVEFSFRLGLAFLLVPSILAVILSIMRKPQQQINHVRPYQLIAICGCAGILLALCGLHPDIPASLALPMFKVAPMFRVAARTYMLVDIALLSITLLLFIQYFKTISNRTGNNITRPLAYLAGFFLMAWLYADAADPRLFPGTPSPLPASPALFESIDPEKPGMVLELPFHSPFAPPEPSYIYFYNWAYHHLPLFNAPHHLLTKTNPGLARQFEAFSKEVNTPDADMINKVGKAGIRYLVINNASQEYSSLDNTSGLQILARVEDSTLYEIRSYNPSGKVLSLLNEYPAGVSHSALQLDTILCQEASLRLIHLPAKRLEIGKNLTLTVEVTNHGPQAWGGALADIRLGAVWFREGKRGKRHNPNYGQTWTALTEPLARGQSSVTTVSLKAPQHPGDYEVWLSLMQPGNTWCFHLGQPPVNIPITVAASP